MASLNLPFGVFRSTRGDLDEKFRVADDSARDSLITNDLVDIGHIIYHVTDNVHYKVDTYPTFGSLIGVIWKLVGNEKTDDETSVSTETVPSSFALSKTEAKVADNETQIDTNIVDIANNGLDIVDLQNDKISKPTTLTPDSKKFLNEEGDYLLIPQIQKKAVYIDNTNGDDTIGRLEDKAYPFTTIQAALNKIRETSGYTPVTHPAHIQPAFWDVYIEESGTYDFEYLSIANVNFISKSNITIRAVSNGKHFTTNQLLSTDPHYDVAKGIVNFDIPNGQFHVLSLDNTLAIRPMFNLRSLKFDNISLLKVNQLTSISSNQQTPFYVFATFLVSDGVDFNYCNVETNRNLVFVNSNASFAKLNFGDINIIDVDEAVIGTSARNTIKFSTVSSNVSRVDFSYSNFNCINNSQNTGGYYEGDSHCLFINLSPFSSEINVGDFNNEGVVWRFVKSITTNYPVINFNNSFMKNVMVAEDYNCTFKGVIRQSTQMVLCNISGSTIRNFVFDGLIAKKLNWDDVSPPIIMYGYQIGYNTIGSLPVYKVDFINCDIQHNGVFLRMTNIETAPNTNTTKYPFCNFIGTNKFSTKNTSDQSLEAYSGNSSGRSAILKTGKLFLDKPLNNAVFLMTLNESNIYQEIT